MIEAMHAAYCALITYYAEHDWSEALPELLPPHDYSLMVKANLEQQSLSKRLLHEGFLTQAKKQPEQPAVVTSTRTLSYQDIEHLSLQVAQQLSQVDEPLIAIVMEKGIEQAIACLGILRNGQAYLPINACWPEGRIQAVLAEGQVKTVLTQAFVLERSTALGPYHCIVVDAHQTSEVLSPIIKEKQVSPEDLAYVIFTSGSTGTPKGVAISHQSAMNTIAAVNREFHITHHDKVLALSDFSFDLSVYDMFGLLSAGGAVVIPDADKIKEPGHWFNLMNQHGVTLWNSVPMFMQMWVEHVLTNVPTFLSMKTVLLSGDWIEPSLILKLKALVPEARLMSLGGATEASIWSVWYDMTSLDAKWMSVPYGRAMPNQQLWILNETMDASPVGVPGQIYIGGAGLAMEYWHDTEKTTAQFVIHPKTHERLYRTGDLGVWHTDGVIQFLGRVDNQVKIAGHRVELGEIASHLKRLNGISNVVVVVEQEKYAKRLIAYLQTEHVHTPTEEEDKIALKLAQKGLQADLKSSYRSNMALDESAYFLRKSYRSFRPGHLPNANLLLSPFRSYKGTLKKRALHLDDVMHLLSPLNAFTSPAQVLPKYRYPSAGSSYAVRAYVNLPKTLKGLKEGIYYYHPVQHSLQYMEASSSDEISLSFKSYLPAIEPLYGKESERFAYLELGHMLALLYEQCHRLQLPSQLTITNTLEGDDRHLAILRFNKSSHTHAPTLHKELLLKKTKTPSGQSSQTFLDGSESYFKSEARQLDIEDLDVFTLTSELGQILLSASALVTFEGEALPEQFIQTGLEAQRLCERWYNQDIGSCPLGFAPYPGALYTLALGKINQADKKALVVPAKQVSLSKALSRYLSHSLSSYMIPDVYMTLKALPLSPQGKLDLKALPKPNQESGIQDRPYVAPQTALEKQLCLLCEVILQVSPIGCSHHFFQAGGDSLLAVQLSNAITKTLKIECPTKAIFDYPLLQDLANHLAQQKSATLPEIHRISRKKPIPLSHAQQRLWFLDRYAEGKDLSYLMGGVFELKGPLDVAALRKSIDFLMKRHEGLRTIFVECEGIGYQQFLPLKHFKLNLHRIAEADLEERLSALWKTPFNLSSAPLIEWHLFTISPARHVLALKIHHIISDGWSFGRLLAEFRLAYAAMIQGMQPQLAPLPFQYADFSVWQRQWLKEAVLEKQELYWKAKLNDAPPVLDLPLDYPRPATLSSEGDSVSCILVI